MESRHCGLDKRIFFCPVHNASTPCSLQAFGVRCIDSAIEVSQEDKHYRTVLILLAMSNSVVNPWVYYFTNYEYKREFKRLCRDFAALFKIHKML